MKYIEGKRQVFEDFGVDYFSLFKECKLQLEYLTELYGLLMEEDSSSNRDDILDAIEEYIQDTDTPHINKYVNNASYNDASIGRRLFDFKNSNKKLIELFDKVLELYIYKRNDRHDYIKMFVADCIGHLALFLYNEYKLDNTLECYAENREIEVSMYVCKELGVNSEEKIGKVIKFCEDVRSAILKFHVNLPVFEEYPELELPFLEKAGAYFGDISELELLITKIDVDNILSFYNPDDVKSLVLEILRRGDKNGGIKKSNSF